MNNYVLIIWVIMMNWSLFSQPNYDARMLGLNGAYTTLARGYQCIGINPANLGIYNNKSVNIFNMAMGLSSNSLSIANYNAINGANLEDSTAYNAYFGGKEAFYNSFSGEGVRMMQSLNFPLPWVNFSIKHFALTSNLITNIDLGMPNGILDFILNGNLPEKNISIDMEQYIFISEETGLSYGHSFNKFSAGFTIKYILGLFYMGVESIDSPYITTDLTGLSGKNQYLIQQAIGGSGAGLDVGITTQESEQGYRFGMSIINLLGTIKWTQDHFMRSELDNTLKNSAGDYYLRPNEFMYINMVMDSMTAESFSETSEPLIYYEIYKVIPIDDLETINIQPDDSNYVVHYGAAYLLPSGGKYERNDLMGDGDIEISNFSNYSKYSNDDSNPFITRQPMYLRMGLSKRWEKQAVVAADLVTGFSNRFGSSMLWRLSIATEIIRFKNKFLRFGYAFGGLTTKSVSLGYGHKIDKIYLDFGISLNGGFTIESAKGIDLAFGLTWQNANN